MNKDTTNAMIQTARTQVEGKLAERPDFRPLLSIKTQLDYLGAYLAGAADGGRLKDINIGLVAAREIEGWDDDLANLLHQIAAEVRALQIAYDLTSQ
jgi:hypothetical protein